MRFRTLLLFLVIAATVVFALLNWPAFTASTTLSLGFGVIEAPLGLLMLGVVVVLSAMFLAYLIYVQGTALMEGRRLHKELQAQRELADRAETSRFTELHNFINGELRTMAQMNADTRTQIMMRIEQLEQRTRLALQETGNSLSSTIGELEDRIEHHRPLNGPPAH